MTYVSCQILKFTYILATITCTYKQTQYDSIIKFVQMCFYSTHSNNSGCLLNCIKKISTRYILHHMLTNGKACKTFLFGLEEVQASCSSPCSTFLKWCHLFGTNHATLKKRSRSGKKNIGRESRKILAGAFVICRNSFRDNLSVTDYMKHRKTVDWRIK